MFHFEEDKVKIGQYLKQLIENSTYRNVRSFCKKYLKLAKCDVTDDSIAKMQNRMSQILKGKKAIQTYDLPLFCELLSVSCEEILSAGKHYEPISGHITNYEIAFSHDKKLWDKYIKREDKLFLNPDEYNNTVIDYALKFKNYEFMKYLMDNNYIWFVDDSKYDCKDRIFGFGAGTSIKRREIGAQDSLLTDLYNCEKHGLRQKMIALAMENNDFKMLTDLRAREIPSLYQLCLNPMYPTNCKDYCDKEVIQEISKSSDKVLGYFSEEFEIVDQFGNRHKFLYPFLSNVIDRMIQDKNKYTEVILRRAIQHNKQALNKLQSMANEAFELAKSDFNYLDNYKAPVEAIVERAMNYFYYHPDDSFISYFFSRKKGDCPKFCTNIIKATNESGDLLIDDLVKELNSSYYAVCNIKPDTSKY